MYKPLSNVERARSRRGEGARVTSPFSPNETNIPDSLLEIHRQRSGEPRMPALRDPGPSHRTLLSVPQRGGHRAPGDRQVTWIRLSHVPPYKFWLGDEMEGAVQRTETLVLAQDRSHSVSQTRAASH